jgi:O-antigen/teichoic acid export membrane protein
MGSDWRGWFRRREVTPPSRWMRVLGVVVGTAQLVGLVVNAGDAQLDDILWGIVVVIMMATLAMAPRALYDGRVTAWERSHPVLMVGLMTVFLGTGVFALLADWLGYGLSALVAYPGMAVLLFVSGRWDRHMREGSPSASDGEPFG